jgi:hypothetical protein
MAKPKNSSRQASELHLRDLQRVYRKPPLDLRIVNRGPFYAPRAEFVSGCGSPAQAMVDF